MKTTVETLDEYSCDLCREKERSTELPEGWSVENGKHYCKECQLKVDPDNVNKYPAHFISHSPQGPHHRCKKHAEQLQGLFGFMGCHTVIEAYIGDPVACINCINESKENEDEEE